MKEFYFSKFENRKPPLPIPDSKARTYIFQFLAVLTIAVGFSYLHWRWSQSINYTALWFSVPLLLAETLSFIGTLLLIFNFWENKDAKKQKPVRLLSEIEDIKNWSDRPLKIDVFIATYNEDVELVRYSIRDAKQMQYPYTDVSIQVYVLDDGKRDGRDPAAQNMLSVAREEGVHYLTRETNEGYKAGNLKGALDQTDGDLFVILDADTRPFSSFLINTTGYFRNYKLAWVQTPQWFYDLTEGTPLPVWLEQKFGNFGKVMGAGISSLFGEIRLGTDLFGNESSVFYDVLQRRRNNYNAAFCCGAGSIHRREAVMSLSIKDFALEVNGHLKDTALPANEKPRVSEKIKKIIIQQPLTPFKYHASEDIYTSILLHADKEVGWESIQHDQIECKMLSPQDLDTWVKQRTRYASGSLDIAFNDNPLLKNGLSIPQRLSYFTTIWSYFSPLWITLFLLSPIIYYFTLTPPVQGYNFDFFKHFIPFQILNCFMIAIGCWGAATKRGDQYYIASFWLMTVALWAVARGKKVNFNVTPKERQQGKYTRFIIPHLVLISLTLAGCIYNLILILNGTHPSLSGFFANTLWSIYNLYHLSIIIRAAYWEPINETTALAAESPIRKLVLQTS